MTQLPNIQMTNEDLLGHTVSEIECRQCGGVFCGARIGRLYDGKPLIMCGQKDCVKEILSRGRNTRA